MLDNKPSLDINKGEMDLSLEGMLEKYQEEFWFFTPDLRTGYDDLKKITIDVSGDFVIKPLDFRKFINRYAPEALTTFVIIVGTHHLLGPARESCDISYLEQLCKNAFFALEVFIDMIGGFVGTYINSKFKNLECDLIQSKDKAVKCLSFTDTMIKRKGCDYEGIEYKPIRIRHTILNYAENEEGKSKQIKKHLNLSGYIKEGILSLSEPHESSHIPKEEAKKDKSYEFPYIIKKQIDNKKDIKFGYIEVGKDGKIKNIHKLYDNGITKSGYEKRLKYTQIRENIFNKLKIGPKTERFINL